MSNSNGSYNYFAWPFTLLYAVDCVHRGASVGASAGQKNAKISCLIRPGRLSQIAGE